jgi:hypothetical protein
MMVFICRSVLIDTEIALAAVGQFTAIIENEESRAVDRQAHVGQQHVGRDARRRRA